MKIKEYIILLEENGLFLHIENELIRCEDCESWQTDWKPKGCEHEDVHFCEVIGRVVCVDHYCGYAERKKDK